jgi:hypothetical protein
MSSIAMGAAIAVLSVLGVSSAVAARGLETGFDDPLFESPDASVRQFWLDRSVQSGATLARLDVNWSLVARSRPADPANPGDPAYDFRVLDGAVKSAAAAGLNPILTVSIAPAWAEGPNRPAGAPQGSWRPRADQLGLFAAALARRYGGAFPDPASGVSLPRVRLFQALNEPNLSTYLSPQWKGRKQVSAGLYRQLLDAFYAGVKGVHSDDLVVSGGTAPFGDSPGGHRTRPVAFWRSVLCLRGKRLRATKCKQRAELDILAHHPINTVPAPAKHALNPDDAASADMGRIRRVLRAAERRHTILPAGRRPLWATEMWWDTNPPDRAFGVSPGRQARFIEQSLFLAWMGGASAVINLQVGDAPANVLTPGLIQHSGLFLSNGSAKPSYTAFRFPFVAQRRTRHTVLIWGRAPAAGILGIESLRGAHARVLRSITVRARQVFALRMKLRRKRTLRASVAGETSLPWTVGQ